MEYAIAGLAIVGFIYFIVHKLSQKVERTRPVSGGGGGRPRPDVQTHEK